MIRTSCTTVAARRVARWAANRLRRPSEKSTARNRATPTPTIADCVRGKTSMRSSWPLRTIGMQCRRLSRCETVRTFTARNRSPTFFAEGQALYREVVKRKAIFQTGSQQRSTGNFHRAVELIRNGLIGKVKEVQIGLPKGPAEIRGSVTLEDRSGREDYQLWTGPAPMLPLRPRASSPDVAVALGLRWRAVNGLDWAPQRHRPLGAGRGSGRPHPGGEEFQLESCAGVQGPGKLRGALRIRWGYPEQHRHA